MLAAIESAKKSVTLCTYIFDNDASGTQFVAALKRAVQRGVAVRVLIDSAGTRYSFPPITWKLRHAKIPFAKFLPASVFTPWRVATINLRNHRKSLVVDGQTGFTGGMNIRHGNVLADNPSARPRFAFPRDRPGRHGIAGSLCERLGVHDERNPRRRNLVS
jgi:cardiolipin synthase